METLFFWLSKIVWFVIAPENLLLILVVLAWVLLLRGALQWAKRILGFTAVVMLLIWLVPVGEWMLYPLESRFPANPVLPPKVDGIIVLGGPEDAVRSAAWGQVEVNEAAERFIASIALYKRYPQARLVFTSGSGSLTEQELKGSDVARKLYAEQGLDLSRILFESQSRNTAENAALSKDMVNPAAGEAWVVVTSAFHMPRSVGIFCKIGWPVIPFPVDHRTLLGHPWRLGGGLLGNLENFSLALKEWIGLAAYYVTGRTTAFVPQGCAS